MFLRQSTAQTIRFGPCLDKTDGVTEETGLTLAQADMRLSKDGGAFAQKNASGNATHDSDGWYSTSLNATDTATVGELILNVHQPANMLPVWMRFYVVEEAVYDDLFATSADPFTVMQSDVAAIHSQTTVIESDTVKIESDTAVIESDTTAIHSDTTIIASDVVIVVSDTTAIHSDTTIIHSDTVVISSDTTAIHSQTTVIESDSVVISSDTAVIESDTTRIELSLVVATGATEGTPTSTVIQTDLAEATDDHYNNMVFVMTSGDEAGEARRISDYTGATGTVTLKTALTGAPTATETFAILAIPTYGDVLASDTAVIESDTTAIHSDTTIIASDVVIVVSDTTAIHSQTTVVESDTAVIESDTTAIHSDTTIIASDVVLVYSDTAAIHSDTTIIASDVVIVVSDTTAIHSDTTIVVSDVALLEGAHSEPTGVPAANESPLDKIGYLFMALRNQVTVTATKKQFFDDAGTAEWEKDLSDDGTTYTETEGNAP